MTAPSVPVSQDSLKSLKTHFAFGENWAGYSALIDESRIHQAELGLTRLVGQYFLNGKSMLDIGCGSGLHTLAALRLGAGRVVAVDIDPNCVETTRKVVGQHYSHANVEMLQSSVFDLDSDKVGKFDLVYSWGVLHHTGAMHEALAHAAAFVAPGGLFVFALYEKTLLCPFWKREKKFYAHSSPSVQNAIRSVYLALVRFSFAIRGKSFQKHLAEYKSGRGMDYPHDVHDWLGGYPYESIASDQVETYMTALGFRLVRRFCDTPGSRIFASPCAEYVYCRE